LFYTTISDETLHFIRLRWTQGFVKFSNAYEFEHVAKCGKLNVQANILKNYVRDVDICTQVYYSFIDTIWNFKDKLSYPNYVAKLICRCFRENLMLLELLYNYHGM
jgi:hypothetical protein